VDYFLVSLLVVFLTLEHFGKPIQHKKIQYKKTKNKDYDEEDAVSAEEDEPSEKEGKKVKEKNIHNKDFDTETTDDETAAEELEKSEKPINILDEKPQGAITDKIENKTKKYTAETFEKEKIIPMPQDKPFCLSTFKRELERYLFQTVTIVVDSAQITGVLTRVGNATITLISNCSVFLIPINNINTLIDVNP